MTARLWTISLVALSLLTGRLMAQDQTQPAPVGPAPLTLAADPHQPAIRIDVELWRVNGTKLQELLKGSPHPVADLLKHNGVTLPIDAAGHVGPVVHVLHNTLELVAQGVDISPAFKQISSPSVITQSAREASVLVGGEIPVPLPGAAAGAQSLAPRPFGIKLQVTPVLLADGTLIIDVTADDAQKSEQPPSSALVAPSVATRGVSAVVKMQAGQSLVIIDSTSEYSLSQMVQLTPTLVTPPREGTSPVDGGSQTQPGAIADAASDLPLAPEKSRTAPIQAGSGVNSDAGVAGSILVESRTALLQAKELTFELTDVTTLGVAVGNTCIVLRSISAGGATRCEAVAYGVRLQQLLKDSNDDFGPARATLSVIGDQQLRVQVPATTEGETWFLVPDNEQNRSDAELAPQRLIEHADRYRRSDDGSLIVEVKPTQSSVRVPYNCYCQLLLPTPVVRNGVSTYVVDLAARQQPGETRIGPWTISFVSQDVWEFERLIRKLEPTSAVEVTEIRSAAVLRGTVVNSAQARAIVEIAEQCFPQVVSQLQVDQAVPSPSANAEQVPGSAITRRVERAVEAEDPYRDHLPSTLRQPSQPSLRVRTAPTADQLPSLDELRELRREVRGLRHDVQRLSDQVESLRKDREPAGAAGDGLGAAATDRSLQLQVYPVADLVVPLDDGHSREREDATSRAEPQPLIELIQATVFPAEWDDQGGPARLEFDDATLSLVVYHHAAAQRQIAELCEGLRKLQDTQVTFEGHVILLQEPAAASEVLGEQAEARIVPSSERNLLIGRLEQLPEARLWKLPKYTLFNGQTTQLTHDSPNLTLILQGVASEHRDAVRLTLGINGDTLENVVRQERRTLRAGESLLLDITDDISPQASALRQLPGIRASVARGVLPSATLRQSVPRTLLLLRPGLVLQPEQELARPAPPAVTLPRR